jgi:hypothetical protein
MHVDLFSFRTQLGGDVDELDTHAPSGYDYQDHGYLRRVSSEYHLGRSMFIEHLFQLLSR